MHATTPANVSPIAPTLAAHEALAKLVNDAMSRRGRIEKARKEAYLAVNPHAVGTIATTSRATKEAYAYPALGTESKEDAAAIALCSALDKLDKLTKLPVLAAISAAYVAGAESVKVDAPKAKAAKAS